MGIVDAISDPMWHALESLTINTDGQYNPGHTGRCICCIGAQEWKTGEHWTVINA